MQSAIVRAHEEALHARYVQRGKITVTKRFKRWKGTVTKRSKPGRAPSTNGSNGGRAPSPMGVNGGSPPSSTAVNGAGDQICSEDGSWVVLHWGQVTIRSGTLVSQ